MNVIIFTGSSWINPVTVEDIDSAIYPVLRYIGPYQIANVLRNADYSVKVIDYFPYLFEHKFEYLIKLIEKFVNHQTIWVGFSSTFFEEYQVSSTNILLNQKIHILKTKILSINKNVKFVLGGSKAWIKKFDNLIDIYVEGYADSTVVPLTKYLQNKNPFLMLKNKTIISDKTSADFNFSDFTFSWHDSDILQKNEVLPIEISRGCIFKCPYCSYPLNGKKKLDFIKNSRLIRDEFTRNYEMYGINTYIYADDTHNDSLDKLRILYDEVYSKLSFDINFSAYLRLDLINAHPEMISLLKNSGLKSCFFGIESLNHKTAKAIGKGISKDAVVEILSKLRKEWQHIFMQAGFIVGLPHESEESASDWLNLICNPEFPLDKVSLNSLHIFKNQGEFAYWANDIEKNPTKYGYTFIDNQNWINNKNMSKAKATQLVNDARKRIQQKKHNMSWLTHLRLQNLGLSKEDFFKFPKNSLQKHVDNFISKYLIQTLNYNCT